MTAHEIVAALAKQNTFATDGDGNVACIYCGAYKFHGQKDGARGPGQHKDDCLWILAQNVQPDVQPVPIPATPQDVQPVPPNEPVLVTGHLDGPVNTPE